MSTDTPRPNPDSSLAAALERAGGAGRGARTGHRVQQIASLIARVLRERLLRGLNDPRVQGMVSVVAVELSPDLSYARVRISVLPADRAKLTLSGLASATRHLEGVVRKATRLRKVPRLVFELDESIKRGSAVLEALADMQVKDPPADAGAEAGAEAGADVGADAGADEIDDAPDSGDSGSTEEATP